MCFFLEEKMLQRDYDSDFPPLEVKKQPPATPSVQWPVELVEYVEKPVVKKTRQANKMVLFIDFDGVLAIPYSNPEMPVPDLLNTLQTLQKDGRFLLCCASFNPRAFIALKRWKVHNMFHAIRVGCNDVWHHFDLSCYDNTLHRVDLCKARQMQSMLQNELKAHKIGATMLIDDRLENIQVAKQKGYDTLFIENSQIGLTPGIATQLLLLPM
jgi:hypothetical protein